MREMFPGFYPLTDQEFDRLWAESIVAFDACALLNIYRYPDAPVNQFLTILDALGDRLWVPHQAAYEFNKNRMAVIQEQQKAYDTLIRTLDDALDSLQKEFRKYGKHVLINSEQLAELSENLRKEMGAVKESLRQQKREHPNRFTEDDIGDRIAELLAGKIGKPYSSKDLEELYRRAESRYVLRIPPGYLDAPNKIGANRYGDVVMWFQLLDQARATERSLIFVTDDSKSDWWDTTAKKESPRTPRPELVQEMYQESGTTLYMYRADDFMEEATKRLPVAEQAGAVQAIRDILQQDEADDEQARDAIELDGDGAAGSLLLPLGLSHAQRMTNALNQAQRMSSVLNQAQLITNALNQARRMTGAYNQAQRMVELFNQAQRMASIMSGPSSARASTAPADTVQYPDDGSDQAVKSECADEGDTEQEGGT